MKAPCGACATCEQCPYDDCTWDGVIAEEWAAAKDTDADARHAVESKQAAQKRAYREANREKVAAQKRAYREANREKVAAYQRAYSCRRCEYLHWWDFIGAFQNIGEGLFASVVNIRSKRARGKKLDKAESAFARENADLIGATAGRMTAEEEEFFKRLGV